MKSLTSLHMTLLLLITGCGLGGLYGPAFYDETVLGERLQRVTFKGGNHPATGDLCLLRCAEVTRTNGFSYFEVVDSESGSSLRNNSVTYPFHRYYHLDEPFMKDIPFVTKTIRMLEKEPKESFAYNAIEVERSMKIKYKIK